MGYRSKFHNLYLAGILDNWEACLFFKFSLMGQLKVSQVQLAKAEFIAIRKVKLCYFFAKFDGINDSNEAEVLAI